MAEPIGDRDKPIKLTVGQKKKAAACGYVYPHFLAMCENCGYVLLFNSKMTGVTE